MIELKSLQMLCGTSQLSLAQDGALADSLNRKTQTQKGAHIQYRGQNKAAEMFSSRPMNGRRGGEWEDAKETRGRKEQRCIVNRFKRKRNEEIKNERSEDETNVLSIAESARARQKMGRWRVNQCYQKRSAG